MKFKKDTGKENEILKEDERTEGKEETNEERKNVLERIIRDRQKEKGRNKE